MSDSTYDLSQVIAAIDSWVDNSTVVGAAVDSVLIDTDPTVVLSYNSARKGFIFYNKTAALYIKLGLGVSADSYSCILRGGKIFAMDHYGGPVSVQAVDSSTDLAITELL